MIILRRICFLLIALILSLTLSNINPLIEEPNSNNIKWIIIHAPAISRTSKGLTGVMTEIWVGIGPGTGDVFVSTMPLTEIDMQASVRIAALVACQILGVDYHKYNFYVKVYAPTSIMGGPSAGALMTIAFIALLANLTLFNNVTMTGMINPDGTIGPVGGIFEKANAAQAQGFKLFLVPYGQNIVLREIVIERKIGPFIIEEVKREVVNLTEYAQKHWNMRIVPVADIYEALKYFTGYTVSRPSIKTLIIPQIITSISKYLYNYIRNITIKEKELSFNTINGVQDSYLRAKLKDLYTSANNLFNKSIEYASNHLYYVAASKCFSAYILYHYINYFCKVLYYKTLSYNAIVSNYTIMYENLLNALQQMKVTKNNIDLIIGAYIRLKDAQDAFRKAINAYKERDYSDSLYWLAYATCRLYDIKGWLNVAKEITPQNATSIEEELEKLSYYYFSEARSVAIYAYTIISEAGLANQAYEWSKKAISYINDANEALSKKEYALALAEAIEALALASSSLNLFTPAIQSNKVIIKYLEKSREHAITSINEAMNVSYPILALCYYQMAESTQNVWDKILMYKYATFYSRIFLSLNTIKGSKIHPLQKIITKKKTTPSKKKTQSTSKPSTSNPKKYISELSKLLNSDFIKGFITGFITMCIIVVIVLSRKRQNTIDKRAKQESYIEYFSENM